MSDRKMSWLKFWPDDYLNSERVNLMTIPQEWAYFRLIIRSARDGSVPATPEECAKLLGKGVRPKDVAVALAAFVPVDGQPDRVTHPRVMRERELAFAKSEQASWAGKASQRKRNGRSTDAQRPSDETATDAQRPFERTSGERQANAQPRALAQEAEAEAEEYSNTNLALERDARSERAEGANQSAWIAREIIALPAAWSPALRAKWAEWLAHLIEREQRKHPAKDPILCRPTTSALDAHRRTLSPLPDDDTRAAWLETAIGAGLSRPAEPTRQVSAGARNQPGAFRAATVQERENF